MYSTIIYYIVKVLFRVSLFFKIDYLRKNGLIKSLAMSKELDIMIKKVDGVEFNKTKYKKNFVFLPLLGSFSINNFMQILLARIFHEKGHDVTVYNSSLHTYKDNEFKGIKIVRKYCPEDKIGAFANFYYDV